MERRLQLLPDGSVVVISDFADLAEPKTISKYLTRLMDKCGITKLFQGLFWKRGNSRDSFPDPNDVASAIARSNNWLSAPSGDTALYTAGLTEKKPTVWTYVTDGTYREYKIGELIIRFQHTTGRLLNNMSKKTALLVQVLKAYGQKALNLDLLNRIKMLYAQSDIPYILNETKGITEWISRAIRTMFEK